ncbi:DUF3037 domain-containing protein [Castellaniella sp.]|uniref:DUF3037 domain-containing protein n=1 Tax=Castellaniella sp. TaxID=1955812 RepID=UPI003C763A81
MKRHPYFYTTLRYMHDIATQEFFVVGVAVFAPGQRFLSLNLRKSLGKAGEIIGSAQLGDFRAIMRMMTTRCSQVAEETQNELLLNNAGAKLEDVLAKLLQADDSALQWAPVQNGLSANLEQTSKRLFARYCEKYDRTAQPKRVTDREAWKKFESKLKDRRVDMYFTEKSIKGKIDDVKFPFAWKNGIWHCIDPVSFDYSDSESIRNKVHRHIGEIATIRDAKEDFKVYYITTPPSDFRLRDAYEKALALLREAPHDKLVVLSEEPEQDDFLDAITRKIADKHGPGIQLPGQPRLLT